MRASRSNPTSLPSVICVLLLCVATAQAQQPTSIPRSVIASGGEIMIGPSHTVIGTIGQPIIGVTTGASHAVGQGFWYTFATGVVTTTGNVDAQISGFNLGRNYPNPFNPSTTIPFVVAGASRVRISIHTVYGEEVAVLVDHDLPVGNGTVVFDATTLPTGVYICRMTAGAFVAERKMSLLK